MEEAGGWFSANLCCPALPSPGPESSSEQLAPLERKLRCLEQEKLELSRKLQGMGAIRARAGWVCPWGCCRRTSSSTLWVSPHCRGSAVPLGPSGAGAAAEGSADSAGQAVRYPAPSTSSLPLPSSWGLSWFPSTPESTGFQSCPWVCTCCVILRKYLKLSDSAYRKWTKEIHAHPHPPTPAPNQAGVRVP